MKRYIKCADSTKYIQKLKTHGQADARKITKDFYSTGLEVDQLMRKYGYQRYYKGDAYEYYDTYTFYASEYPYDCYNVILDAYSLVHPDRGRLGEVKARVEKLEV